MITVLVILAVIAVTIGVVILARSTPNGPPAEQTEDDSSMHLVDVADI
jgi:hypothetical protein